MHGGAYVRWAEHLAAIRGWPVGERGDARRRNHGRGRDAEREDDPVDSVARGCTRIEKGEAASGFRGARGGDDDAQGLRSAEPAAGADWREDLREPAEFFGGQGTTRTTP